MFGIITMIKSKTMPYAVVVTMVLLLLLATFLCIFFFFKKGGGYSPHIAHGSGCTVFTTV